ncbi:MAG: hypothetical protein CMH85_01235 [Novosphingobium sp.]|nr:hypothetical protein [Novosphingobium sp.]
MPIDRAELHTGLIKSACVIGAQLAEELDAKFGLSSATSEVIEAELRKLADLCRRSAGDVAETKFLEAAERIAARRGG